ncbi:MAG: hypothetical protein M3R24_26335 [Chloroflexota bacterium]|nr:hypothetical protein [Chloroflexota bacterium]
MARLQKNRDSEQALKIRLRQGVCPPSQELGDYHLGLLRQSDERRIGRHIEGCPRCSAELAELRRFLDNESGRDEVAAPVTPPPAPYDRDVPTGFRFRELILRLGAGRPTPAVRGAGPSLITAGGADVLLVLEAQTVGQGQVQVDGQLSAQDLDAWTEALVEVRQQGVVRGIGTVSDLGAFRVGPFPAGPTTVRITAASGYSVVLEETELWDAPSDPGIVGR